MSPIIVTLALILAAGGPGPAQEPGSASYTQAAFCTAVGGRLIDLVNQAERSQGPSPESQALGGQAGLLVERARERREAARAEEAVSDEDVAMIDGLITTSLDEADASQFENGVLNCFSLFGVD